MKLSFSHISHAKQVTIEVGPNIVFTGEVNLADLLITTRRVVERINGPIEDLPTHEEIAKELSKVFEKC